ncbi:hypothetical protein [Miltoncostaea marina]|uniref:hypothetical protein n=1 Tax=Miltoncostaea marina TaxID=2843215 RepID=UPI001C3E6BA2|nr:hypothetical protein [Miltoncostaea marina]
MSRPEGGDGAAEGAPAATDAGRPGRGRRWLIVVVSIAAVVLGGWALSAMIVSGSQAESAALDQARRAAAPGLGDMERGAAGRGEELDVDWSVVADPTGRTHMVTARVRLVPSGQGATAAFLVSGERVMPQDALARQLIRGMR